MPVNAVRLNHAVLYVADLERSVAFYQQAFGMEVMAREPRAKPRSCGCPGRATTTTWGCSGSVPSHRARAAAIGLYHLAWQVDTIEELEEARLDAGATSMP